jgi:hypothetical protein
MRNCPNKEVFASGGKCGKLLAFVSGKRDELMNDTHIYGLVVRVLIYQEDEEICAHALELDLLGYGKTEKEAISELFKVIQCQISFARTNNDDSILRSPAPKEFYDRWESAHAAALKNLVFPEKSKAFAIKAICVSLEKPLTTRPKARFEAVEPICA